MLTERQYRNLTKGLPKCRHTKLPTIKWYSSCGYGCNTPTLRPDTYIYVKYIDHIDIPESIHVHGVIIDLDYKQQNIIRDSMFETKVKEYPEREKYIKKAQHWINSVAEGYKDGYDVRGRFRHFPEFQEYKMYSFNWPTEDELFGIALMHYGKKIVFGMIDDHYHGN